MKPLCLVVSCICPPIPIRHMDWRAYVDGHEEGCVGYGPTREAAVADLYEQLEDDAA